MTTVRLLRSSMAYDHEAKCRKKGPDCIDADLFAIAKSLGKIMRLPEECRRKGFAGLKDLCSSGTCVKQHTVKNLILPSKYAGQKMNSIL